MPERDDYINTFRRICEQADRSGLDFDMLTRTPTGKVDDSFTVSFGVGGLVTLLVDPARYEELRSDLDPLMRKILRDLPEGNLRKIDSTRSPTSEASDTNRPVTLFRVSGHSLSREKYASRRAPD